MYAQIMGIVRHILTFVGGALVAVGVTTSVDWSSVMSNFDTVTGGVVALIAVVASIWTKLKSEGGIVAVIKAALGGGSTPPAA